MNVHDEIISGQGPDFVSGYMLQGLIIEIKEHLKNSTKTQSDIARFCGFSRAYVSKLLSGKIKNITILSVCKLSAAIGVTPRLEFSLSEETKVDLYSLGSYN